MPVNASIMLDVAQAGNEMPVAVLDRRYGRLAVEDALRQTVLLSGWRFPDSGPICVVYWPQQQQLGI